MPLNDRGTTPTMVAVPPSTVIGCPSTPGSPPKCSIQKASLITAAIPFALPPGSSSCQFSKRPRRGLSFKVGKAEPVAYAPVMGLAEPLSVRTIGALVQAKRSVNALCRSRRRSNIGPGRGPFVPGGPKEMCTSSRGEGTARLRSSKASIKEKTAVLEPIPSARVKTATAVNPGFFLSIRKPYRASSSKSPSHLRPHSSRVTSFTKPTFPNSRSAACSASFRSAPRATRVCTDMLKCARSSSSSSASRVLRRQKIIEFSPRSQAALARGSHLFGIQHAGHGIGELGPLRTFPAQLFLSRSCELVVLRPLLILRNLPFRLDPLLLFQSVQGRIERSRVHLQNLAGAVADGHANSIAMLRPPLQRLQDQEIQSSLQ